MSHFTVIVIGPDFERQLAPYHEFECTGIVDEFVRTIDETDKKRAEFETETARRVRLADGSLVSAYDDRFYRDPTPEEKDKIGPIAGTGGGNGLSWRSKDWGDGRGYRTKIHDLGGAEEIEVKRSEFKTFRAYLEDYCGHTVVPYGEQPDLDGDHKFGWVEVDAAGEVVKVVDRTNPNRKWDWYSVGGRWSGFFPLKPGARGEVGQPGAFDNKPAPHTADQCRWGDVDIDRARRNAEEQARNDFAKWRAAFERHGRPKSWTEIREAHGNQIDAAREEYRNQPAIRAFNGILDCPVQVYGFDEEAYVAAQRARALVPFAVVKDGNWYEKGKMGWWGTVSDGKEQADWNAQVAALFDGLDPETIVALVDCHI